MLTAIQNAGFILAPETFDINHLPSTITDRGFVLEMESEGGNPSWPQGWDRFYPMPVLKVSVSFDLGNNDPLLLSRALEWNENLMGVVIDPKSWDSLTKNIIYQNSRPMKKKKTGSWLIVENLFKVEYAVMNEPYLTSAYTDTQVDNSVEMMDAGEYSDTLFQNTIDSGTY